MRNRRAVRKLLLGVPLLEAGHPATGVEDLLLAGVEGVALRAHVGVDHAALRGRARLERGATGAGHRGVDVRRVDVALHNSLLGFRCPGSPARYGREPEPASKCATRRHPARNPPSPAPPVRRRRGRGQLPLSVLWLEPADGVVLLTW